MSGNNIWKEIALNDIDHRYGSIVFHQNNLKQIGNIKAVNTGVTMNACDMISSAYLPKKYPYSNLCVWLAIFLAVCSVDPAIAKSMIHIFVKSQGKLVYLTLLNENKDYKLNWSMIC